MKPFLLKCRPNHVAASFTLYRDYKPRAQGHFLFVCGLYCAYYRLDPPPFMTTQWSGFDNLYHVTDVTIVLFIVSQNLFCFPDYLFVKGMLIASNNRHCDSFIHVVTGNMTCPKFAMSLSFLAQLYPPNQSKLIVFMSTQYKLDETESGCNM